MAIFHMKFATTKNAGPCLTTLATMRHTTLFASSLHCVRTSFKDHPNYQIMGGIVVKTQEAILSPEQVQFQLLALPVCSNCPIMEPGSHSGIVSHRPSLKLALDYNLKLPFLNASEKEHGLIVKQIFEKLLQVLKPGYISKLVYI